MHEDLVLRDCAVGDAISKRIVSHSIGAQMTADPAVNAPGNALALRGPVGATVDSDRGSPFRSQAHVRALRDAQLGGSMGRVRCLRRQCRHELLLEENVLSHQRWTIREQLSLAIVI